MTDRDFMERALELAKTGDSRTEPNPKVGAVIVKDGEIIGEGFHKIAGEAHAEVNAFRDAQRRGKNVKDATLYVTLEPCSHYGKTPPCAEMIAKSGIKKVISAMEDRNPKVSGKGFEILRNTGIEVEVGLLKEEAEFLDRVFISTINSEKPYVFLKAGASLDGKIQTSIGESKWITSEESREDIHKFRSEVGAIAVGIGTVLSDNPTLTARSIERENIDPVAVVFDSKLQIPVQAKILNRNSDKETIIFTANPDREKLQRIKRLPRVEVYEVQDKDGRVSVEEALKILRKKDILSLLLEGGGTLNDSFIRDDFVDELLLYFAPILIGGNTKSFIAGTGIKHLNEAKRFLLYETKKFGEDLFLRYLKR